MELYIIQDINLHLNNKVDFYCLNLDMKKCFVYKVVLSYKLYFVNIQT